MMPYDDTTRVLLEAVAARRAARRTPHDDVTEVMLAVVSIAVTAVVAITMVRWLTGLV